MKRFIISLCIVVSSIIAASQEPPVKFQFMYEFSVPNDSYDKYKELLAPKYGYCTQEQVNELTSTITIKNNSYDKQFNETYNKYKSINDTLVALLEANVIELLQIQIDSIRKKKDEIYRTSFNNVKNIYYSGVYVVIVTAEFSKYTRAQLDSIALYKAFNDGIQKFCKTTVSDTIKYTQYDGISRNSNIYRSLNLEIIGNAKAGTKVSDIISYQPDRDFFFKVYEINIYPFSKSQPNFNTLNNFSKNIANNSLYALYSYDVFSPSQSLKDFLEQQKIKYNLFSHEVDKIINFVDRLKLEIPDKNLEQYKNEVEEIKKITNKLNEYDNQIAFLEKQIETHKNTIKRIITNQTEDKCIYISANLRQSIKSAIDYFNNKLSSIELELQAISQKKYFHDIISFKSGEQGYIWEQIYTQIKSGNNTNNLKTIEQRISADYELFKKISVVITSDNDNSNTSSVTKKTESVTYSRKLDKYWLYLQLDPPTGNINIHVVSVCKLSKTIKSEKEKNNPTELPSNKTEVIKDSESKKPENIEEVKKVEESENVNEKEVNNNEQNNYTSDNVIESLCSQIDRMTSNSSIEASLIDILEKKQLSNNGLLRVFKSISRMTSNSSITSVLNASINQLSDNYEVIDGFFRQVDRMTSNSSIEEVLNNVLTQRQLNNDGLLRLFISVSRMTSNSSIASVLVEAINQMPNEKKITDAFLVQVNRMTSNSSIQSVMDAYNEKFNK